MFEKPDRHHVCPQEAELDDSSLIGLSVPGDVAKKLLHYLKQKLPSSCLGDLLCSHAFAKHYLKRGGASLEDEELLGKKTNTPLVSASSTLPRLTVLVCASLQLKARPGWVAAAEEGRASRLPRPPRPRRWAPSPKRPRKSFLWILAAAARRRRATCPQRTSANTPTTWRTR